MMLLLKVEKRNYQKGELNGPAAISWPRCYHYSDDSGAVHGGVHGVNMYSDGYQSFDFSVAILLNSTTAMGRWRYFPI